MSRSTFGVGNDFGGGLTCHHPQVLRQRPQSRRDCVLQPGVASRELPWVALPKRVQPCKGCSAVQVLGELRSVGAGASTLSGMGNNWLTHTVLRDLYGVGRGVAQISNLPYRRIPFCRAPPKPTASICRTASRLEIGDIADWKSALRARRALTPNPAAMRRRQPTLILPLPLSAPIN